MTKSWTDKFTEREWSLFREHAEIHCKCSLCQRIRRAIKKEVRRPLPKQLKEDKIKDEARYKEWQAIPIEAHRAYDTHPAKCECKLCMVIKNFYGRNLELEEIMSKYEAEKNASPKRV